MAGGRTKRNPALLEQLEQRRHELEAAKGRFNAALLSAALDGYSLRELARHLDVTAPTVGRWLAAIEAAA